LSYYDSNPDLFWHPKTEEQVKLGDVRGKIVLLDNFSSSTKYGMNYEDWSQFNVQDDYKFTSNWDLYGKWEEVKQQIQNADVSKRAGEHVFFINYLSASYGTFPFFVSSGHISPGTGAHRLSTGLTTLTSQNKY
jgi:1-phosphatidylinositol phosphodiesterase